MRCPNCQRESEESAIFCNQCGTQLQSVCANCDTFNPLDSNYCSRCGLSLYSGLQEPRTPARQEPQASSSIHFASCPRCGKVNEPGSAYCYSCGLPMDEIETPPQSSTTQYSRYTAQAPPQTLHPSQDYAVQPAGFWIRLVASFIDGLILTLFILTLAGVLQGVTISEYFGNFSWESDETTPLWFDTLEVILSAMYSAVLVSMWSATIGKRILGLYVLRSDGSKAGFGRALARWACYIISFLTLGIGFLMIAFREDKRGLHDLICGTMVVKR